MEKIKIFHSADMHGDLDSLDTYIEYVREKKPDITLVTGDLVHGVFTEEELKQYMKHRELYEGTKMSLLGKVIEEAKKIGKEKIMELFPPQLFQAIQEDSLKEKSIIDIHEDNEPSTKDLHEMINPKTPPAIANAISPYLDARETYQKYVQTGRESMESQYRDIKRIIENTDCLILPGNHDGECLEEILSEKNIHKKSVTTKDIKIAGYGSAAGMPVWIPSALLEKFRGIKVVNKQEKELVYDGSEAGWFMIEEDPDIAVFHETPLIDESLMAYVKNESPYLILAGHLHEGIGIYKFNEGSHLILPGKLGNPDMEPKDHSTLRTFVEIDLLKEKETSVRLQPEKVTFHQIKNGKIEPFAEYKFDEHGNFKSKENISKDCSSLKGWL